MTDKSKKYDVATPDKTSVDILPDLGDVVSPVQSGSLLEMQTGLYNLAENRALQSGTLEPRSEDILSLTEHARAMARQTYRDKYDPSQNAHDAMHQAEYQRVLTQRGEAEQVEQHAAANLRDAEINVARTQAGPKPRLDPLLIAAFIVAITLTVAPTLHDNVFFTIGDDLLAWFAAALGSSFVGTMVTLAILKSRRSNWEWVGVAAGVILGLGLGVVRLSAASGAGGGGIFAVGLTIIEIAAVLLLEWLARGLRPKVEEWLARHDAEAGAVSERIAAQAELMRWQIRVKELNEFIASKIDLVENRHERNIHLPELEAVAIKAVKDGYNAGITKNIGRVRGVRYAIRRSQ
jgi:hypothetical protein